MRDEVTFLQRKLKYLQSVSTIFRQKIALIMRECSKNPQSFPEYHRMYTKVLGEVTRAESEFEAAPTPATDDAAAGAAKASNARSDVSKAHQLCLVLQEKNDLKKKDVEQRAQLEQLQKKYDEVCERHTRLVELSSTGGGTQAAQHELHDKRVAELERALLEARAEIMRMQVAADRRGGSVSTSDATAEVLTQYVGAEQGSLLKQNNMLKARCTKLKEELASALEGGVQKAADMGRNVDVLAAQVKQLKGELDDRQLLVRQAQGEKLEVAKELVHQRKTEELLRAKVAALEAELDQLLRGGGGAAAPPTSGDRVTAHDTQSTTVGGGAADGHFTDAEQQAKLGAAEAEVEQLRGLVATLQAAAQQKDVELASLGAQIKSFRARMDHTEALKEQAQVQQTMVEDVQRSLLGAVSQIQESQTTQTLSQQMGLINEQLQRLESLELQLRQKEDLLAVAEDEVARLEGSNAELQRSLGAVSGLFIQLPRSIEALERLVIERDEYKGEVHRCGEQRELPDVVEVDGRVELRCLEVETARRANRALLDRQLDDSARVADGTSSLEAAELLGTIGTANELATAEDGQADEVAPDTLALPPPPPLMDITLGHADPEALRAALGQPPAGRGVGSPDRVGAPISDEDVTITFNLFDEQGTGALPADVLRLCLSTLGLAPSLLPTSVATMTLSEFVALCATRSA